ncbi:MAG TPA: ABC transporter substrate-binding protein [Candidatus Binatia bacterium]|jgi:NitT/TauT family transport system substrate-binding protein|nr:ABC transporter substrate-binding protein [Candidatus Binatia bacterium]
MRKVFSAAVLLLTLWPALAHAQPRSKVTIGYASMSSVATTLWAAQEKGFFAKNGIDAAAIFIPGSPTLIATLNSGDVQFGYTGGTATLGAAVGGLDLKVVAAFANHSQSDFVTRPEIKTAADLKGKRIGVTSIGGTGWMAAMLALEQLELSPERDKISLAAFGDQRVISQAIETNTVQGASLAGVFSRRLQRAGYHFLADMDKVTLLGNSLVVKADYLAGQSAVVRNVLKALIEAHGYVLNPANKTPVIELMSKKLGVTDPVAASDGYDDYVRHVERRPFVLAEGLKNVQRFMKARNPKIADMPPERFIDETILRELDKSGFLDQALTVRTAR